ncbi:SUKH-4 family immunity protein [Streptomyces sp. NPDC001595]|uniref:SUKH-4 family immunity protein n=1 Tax=Streptomyces sp. NPDC001532 TaxID=3154520 RepID=UPI00331C632C
MNSAEMIRAYGLENVVYFPRHEAGPSADARALTLLSAVGLPHSVSFSSRMDPEDPYDTSFDPVALGGFFGRHGIPCPEECRSWWKLGTLFTSVVALDPESGKVYGFPEGSWKPVPLHRDVESLMFGLIEFRRIEDAHDAEEEEPEELAERFRETLREFDPTPFEDEESQWNVILEELENGIW